MSQEITLQQAAERAHQIEVICALAEDYPSMMTDRESGAIISLLKRLSGEVCVFLIDEQERRTLISNEKNAEGYMCNKTTPDAAAALTTLIHALIDIECTAELAQGEEQKDRTQFALECIRYIATRSLNDAKNILVADCENGGGVMRDDRFNSLKQEFSGVPDDAADALSSMPELIRAAFFLLSTREYKSTGLDVLNIAADYAEYVAEARYRRKFPEDVSHA
ncbi:hypothetical protein OkiPb00529_07950 [Escherichia coli]|nr:hypothetical protein EC40522_2199 [Escherichia coli 4.0522]